MKKLHFYFLAGILSALAITNNVKAQPHDLAVRPNFSEKKISKISNHSFSAKDFFSDPKMNTHARKDFKKHYKTSDEQWVKSSDGIMASFRSENTNYIVYYNKKGHWVATLKSYAENLLDKDIRTMVKREYFDFHIKGIKEIEYNGYNSNPTYIVIIQHDKSVKWICINNGTMSVYKEL